MPSFDVVSEVNLHEVTNAIDQANREVTTRFDFKGTGSQYEHTESEITLHAQEEYQLKQMIEILRLKLSQRKVDIKCLKLEKPELALKKARQKIVVQQGIDKEMAKKIVKMVKDAKLKVQASVQGEQVRVTGKKRDDLQQVIALLRDAKLDLPLQYVNFRD
ncbi:MAG: YajQ family cyclic di-GMP-binding protein [Deferribacteres bacterium]|nr:YajQ family cyclic di-GMP-binding protein [candidate division KSB1 bacterium]MCB9508658.1 YajQ family cyclic di-GMP-binding protein [Deferribacteres bacterium]